MILYLGGPMSGLPNHGYDLFEKAVEKLTPLILRTEQDIIWPANRIVPNEHTEACPPGRQGAIGHTEACHLRADLTALLSCTHAAFLPGWETSWGSKLEMQVASASGLSVMFYTEDEHARPWLFSGSYR